MCTLICSLMCACAHVCACRHKACYMCFVGWVIMCCLVGWRVCFRGCGAPEIGKSLNSGREEGEGVHHCLERCLGLAGSGGPVPSSFWSPEQGPFPLGCLPGFSAGIRLFFVEIFVLRPKATSEILVPVKDRPPPGGREGHGQGRL